MRAADGFPESALTECIMENTGNTRAWTPANPVLNLFFLHPNEEHTVFLHVLANLTQVTHYLNFKNVFPSLQADTGSYLYCIKTT